MNPGLLNHQEYNYSKPFEPSDMKMVRSVANWFDVVLVLSGLADIYIIVPWLHRDFAINIAHS